MQSRTRMAFAFAAALLALASQAFALDDEHWQKANDAIKKGLAHLRTTQAADGSWSPKPGPAVTALSLTAMLEQGDIKPDDPAVQKGLAYVLSMKHDDGGIHAGMLENYNTAICLSMLPHFNDRPDVAKAIKQAQDYLRGLQWHDQKDPQGNAIDEKHPFYGGAGYGGEGRPDMSNTQMMLQGLHDSGVDCNDPAFQRAVVFITRCQGTAANKEFGNKIVPDGGFIYATSKTKDKIGDPESKPGLVEMEDGTSRLATYGSMTYAGFKGYLYAKLDRNDPRVQDAYKWIRNNYRLDANPGLKKIVGTPQDERLQGYYYYLLTFSRALKAWGEKTVTTPDGKAHDWANDLVDKLVSLQKPDGSWTNDADRWMEGDPNLVTAYAVLALESATK